MLNSTRKQSADTEQELAEKLEGIKKLTKQLQSSNNQKSQILELRNDTSKTNETLRLHQTQLRQQIQSLSIAKANADQIASQHLSKSNALTAKLETVTMKLTELSRAFEQKQREAELLLLSARNTSLHHKVTSGRGPRIKPANRIVQVDQGQHSCLRCCLAGALALFRHDIVPGR
jgi:hypothetical protein